MLTKAKNFHNIRYMWDKGKGCERKEYAGKIATERECHRLKAFPAGTGGKCVRELVRRSATSGWEKGAESGTDGARYAHKEGRISEKF